MDYYRQHALALLAKGYEPIPETLRERVPMVDNWTERELDEATVRGWAANGKGHAGLALRTGRVVALDIDVYDEAVVRALQRVVRRLVGDPPGRRGQPPKVALLMRTDAPARKRTSTCWVDPQGRDNRIEVLSQGSKLTLANVHPATGREYQLSTGPVESLPPAASLPLLTEDLLQQLFAELDRQAERRGWRLKAAGSAGPALLGADPDDEDAHYLAHHRAPEGLSSAELQALLDRIDPDLPRDDWIRAGMALHHETGGSPEGLDLWDLWSATGTKYAGVDDLGRSWDSFNDRDGLPVVTAGTLRHLAAQHVTIDDEVAGEVELADEIDDGEDDGGDFDTFGWEDLDPDGEPPEQLVEDLLTVGSISVLSSQPNTGKSAFAIDLAAHVARGAKWRGSLVQQGHTLYVAAESPESVKSRLLAIKQERDWHDVPVRVVREPTNLTTPDGRKKFATKLRRHKRKHFSMQLVVLDTLRNACPGLEENDAKEVGAVILFLDRLAKALEIHILILHHMTKAGGTYAGSGQIGAVVDTEMVLEQGEGEDADLVCLTVRQQRSLTSRGNRFWYRIVSRTTGRINNFLKEETAPLVEHVTDADREFLRADRQAEAEQQRRAQMDAEALEVVRAMVDGATSQVQLVDALGKGKDWIRKRREAAAERGWLALQEAGLTTTYVVTREGMEAAKGTSGEVE